MCGDRPVCATVFVWMSDYKLEKVDSLFLPCACQGSNSACQAWSLSHLTGPKNILIILKTVNVTRRM